MATGKALPQIKAVEDEGLPPESWWAEIQAVARQADMMGSRQMASWRSSCHRVTGKSGTCQGVPRGSWALTWVFKEGKKEQRVFSQIPTELSWKEERTWSWDNKTINENTSILTVTHHGHHRQTVKETQGREEIFEHLYIWWGANAQDMSRNPTSQQQTHKFSIKTWEKDLKRHFYQDKQIIKKHMKRYSIPLVNREMQIKATMGYHLILIRMATIKKIIIK